MPRLDESHQEIIQALADQYGPPPPASPELNQSLTLFERLSVATLGRVATPKVAASAFDALRDAGLLEPTALAAANPLEIDDVLKQARVAVALRSIRPLQKLARWASELVGTFDPATMADRSTESIRDDWRGINGIGLASADALLLTGLERASYPVDRATYRVLVRHGWIEPTAEYDDARTVMEKFAGIALDRDQEQSDATRHEVNLARLLAELSHWFERLGKDFCRPGVAHCDKCPLRGVLPAAGPVEVE